jgi:hypothetical protein
MISDSAGPVAPGGLPTGSDSSKNPVQQAEIAESKINPITAAWVEGTPEQRKEFIEWLYDDAPTKVTEWLHDEYDDVPARATPDDGLGIPDYLKRGAP